MKNPNGYGCVSKLSGKRRRPWIVRVTTGFDFDDIKLKHTQIMKPIGYYATRVEALQALAAYNNDPFDVDVLNVTFRECFEKASKDFTEGRRNNYMAAFKFLEPIADIPIRQIKAPQMQACIDACQTSQQGEIKTVCHKVYHYARVAEIVDKDPSALLHSVKKETEIERVPFTADEIAQFDNTNEWYNKVTMILLYTGMRTKELRTLQPHNCHLDDPDGAWIELDVAKNQTSKRRIPIHTHIQPIFKDYMDAGSNLYGYTHNAYNNNLKKSPGGHTAHDARHTFATRMRQCGCDPLVLQELLGHAKKSITEKVYTHLTLDELRQAIALLNY